MDSFPVNAANMATAHRYVYKNMENKLCSSICDPTSDMNILILYVSLHKLQTHYPKLYYGHEPCRSGRLKSHSETVHTQIKIWLPTCSTQKYLCNKS
jgi:hypothetical protein